MKVEETILWKEIKNRNIKVFEAFFREYYPLLTKFAEGFVFDDQVAEDLVQNLFLYLWEHAGRVEIESSLKSYLYQAVKNRCLNYLRDLHVEDKRKFLYVEACLNEEDLSDWPDIDLTRRIEAAIGSLPSQMKELFMMKYFQGMKSREIARIRGISENTLQTQLQRAKEKLRGRLTELTLFIL